MQRAPAPPANPHHDRRWLILAVIGIAQLMVVLDVTIVNIALPSAQRDLGFSDDDRQWVITAYALAFGGLLLLGGRIADLFGRKRTFIDRPARLRRRLRARRRRPELRRARRGPRRCRASFAAMLAPAALSLLTTTFTDPAERGKAFGVFGAIAGVRRRHRPAARRRPDRVRSTGAGACTSTCSSPSPAALAALAPAASRHGRADRPRLDIPGTLAASAGLFALVFGLSQAETDGWGDPSRSASCSPAPSCWPRSSRSSAASPHPLLPLRVVADRNRGGSYLAIAIAGAGIFGVFLFLTFYLQNTKGLTALETGLAFLPMSVSIAPPARIVSTRAARRAPAPARSWPPAWLLAALGMVLLTRIGVDTAYASHVLPSLC